LARSRFRLLVVAAACLWAPSTGQANGDPASDYLLTQRVFLPFTTKIDQNEVTRLNGLLRDADQKRYRIRVALILSRGDLGTAFSLFGKPGKYAQFLGLELAFVYRGRLLVVMPNGFGYAVNGDPDPKSSALLKKLPAPGPNATKEVQAAIVAVQRLAAVEGHRLVVPKVGSSTGRDRLTIAAAATAGIALIAAIVLFRRRKLSAGN
jgi:hypothetical protein